MTISTKSANGVVTITLDNSFSFESVTDFRSAYTNNPGKEYLVDFRNTEYMESSGLGMLLNMLKFAGENKAKIRLVNCRPHIQRVLKISNFQKKFDIG